MGLFKRTERVPATAVVESFGIGQTTTAANESGHQHKTKGSLTLTVALEGQAPYWAVVRGKLPSQKMPSMGDTLPVLVNVDDQGDVEVDWDQVPTIVERMAQLAKDGEEARRTGQQVGRVSPPQPPATPPA
jgi:hypothetical protein